MTDKELFYIAIGYHHYLQSCNFGNSRHPLYPVMVSRHVWFDDHDYLSPTDLPQIYRVARLVRRYLRGYHHA